MASAEGVARTGKCAARIPVFPCGGNSNASSTAADSPRVKCREDKCSGGAAFSFNSTAASATSSSRSKFGLPFSFNSRGSTRNVTIGGSTLNKLPALAPGVVHSTP